MAVFNTSTADGRNRCQNATYTTARSGGGTFATDTTATYTEIGQELAGGIYYCYEAYWSFDTSSIPSNATIDSVTLEAYIEGISTSSSTAGVPRVRVKDWGTTVTSSDWVAGASVSGQTLVAHFASMATLSGQSGTYVTAVDDDLAANIVKAGTTKFMVTTDRFEAGTAPGVGGEYVSFGTANGSNPPKLTVTWTVPSTGSPNRRGGLLSVFALPGLR